MEMIDFIKIYDDPIKIETMSKLLRYANTVKFKEATIIGDNNDHLDKSVRNTKVYPLDRSSESMSTVHWASLLEKVFSDIIVDYFKSFNTENSCTRITDISILKYTEGGFYKYHTDFNIAFPRNISMIYLLNNDYEGGELCFKELKTEEESIVEKRANRLIIWPSNFIFPHTVKPVKKGIRYSIVGWAA